MAWESRGNRKYYYRKKRIGKQVRSIYVGDQITGFIPAMEDENKKILGDEPMDIKLHECLEREKELDNMAQDVELVVNSLLLISGYHCHKGQWRKSHERNH
jgi:hypothetical protein